MYKMFRHFYRADGVQNEDFFAIPPRQFLAGTANADMIYAEADFVEALASHGKEKGAFPPMNHDALMTAYPGLYQSLLQIVHNTESRCNARAEKPKAGR